MFYKSNPTKRLTFVLAASIFVGEALIMLLISYLGPFSVLRGMWLDATLLTSLMVPLVYFTVSLPVKKHINRLRTAEALAIKEKEEAKAALLERDGLISGLLKAKNQVLATQDQTLSLLNALASAKDNETGHHIVRTQNYVLALAQRLRQMGQYAGELDPYTIDLLFKAAPLHDIGKMGIPDEILKKPGAFTQEERQMMNTHTTIGAAILDTAKLNLGDGEDVISMAAKIAGCHHEKWNGTGYPEGLSGDAIPLAARIMSVADFYDALVGERAYKKSWTHESAAAEILKQKGLAFDPIVVDAFVLEKDHFKQISEGYRD